MKLTAVLVILSFVLAVAGCGKDSGDPDGASVSLIGAGATFPQPLYAKWSAQYARINPNVKINYQGIGSGGGIRQISERTVDFGATDGPMTDAQMQKAQGKLLHIPMTLGAVVPIYNLPEVSKPLVFSGPVLADLFLGKITKWNDPRLVELNPDAGLPDRPVTTVHRSDGSGTSYIFTDYLSKVSQEWRGGPGKGTTVNWPSGRGAKGNDGVAADVKQNPGSLGYVELIYAANNNISYGAVINAKGEPILASIESVTRAAGSFEDVPNDLRMSITNPDASGAYPISGMTWILIYQQQQDPGKAKALVDFLWWATHDGQAMTAPLRYAPLPEELLSRVEQMLKSVTVNGSPLLSDR